MSFFGEFKEFISRGNVVDMAVGVVVGGAFKAIVDSLVKDIITPVISTITGKVDIASLAVTVLPATDTYKGLTIPYGNFLQEILNFLIIAFSIFCVIKGINTVRSKLEKKKEEEPEPEPEVSNEEKLLIEIRDLLAKKD